MDSLPNRSIFASDDFTSSCTYCYDPACWRGCNDASNPFGQLGLELKKLLRYISPTSWWHHWEVRRLLGAWTYRAYCLWYRRSERVRDFLDKLAEEMSNDLHHTVNRGSNLKNLNSGPPCLPQILGLLQGFNRNLKIIDQVIAELPRMDQEMEIIFQKEEAEKQALSSKRSKYQGKPRSSVESADTASPTMSHIATNNRTDDSSSPEPATKSPVAQDIVLSQSSSLEQNTQPKGEVQTSNPFRMSQVLRNNVLGQDSSLEQNTQPKRKVQASNGIRPSSKTPSDSSVTMSPIAQGNVSNEVCTYHSPFWAQTYQPGSLAMLNLTPGKYDLNITTPQGKQPGPAGVHVGTTKPPSIPWMCYALLRRVPGGWMSSSVLKGMVVEWSTWYTTDAEKVRGRNTVGQQVSKHPSMVRETRKGFPGRRIAGMGEVQEKLPGPGNKRQNSESTESSRKKRKHE